MGFYVILLKEVLSTNAFDWPRTNTFLNFLTFIGLKKMERMHAHLNGFPQVSLSINALCARVYIYIRQLSSFMAPTLWFIDLTVAACHIQYTFLSLWQFFFKRKMLKVHHLRIIRKWPSTVLGAQSINADRP